MTDVFGTTALTDCAVSGNSAGSANSPGFGGGIEFFSNTTTLTNCNVNNNFAGYNGGGGGLICSGNTTLTNCTISGNSVPGPGGSGGGLQPEPGGTTTLTNCTISGNSVGFNGGGLANYGDTTTLTNCTVSGNSSVPDRRRAEHQGRRHDHADQLHRQRQLRRRPAVAFPTRAR